MSVPLTRILADLDYVLKNDTDIVAAFGVASSDWSAHVFAGISEGFNGARNRGRLPYVEYEGSELAVSELSADSVEQNWNIDVRIHAALYPAGDDFSIGADAANSIVRAWRNWWFGTSTRSQTVIANAQQLYRLTVATVGERVEDHGHSVQDIRLVVEAYSAKSDLGDV